MAFDQTQGGEVGIPIINLPETAHPARHRDAATGRRDEYGAADGVRRVS